MKTNTAEQSVTARLDTGRRALLHPNHHIAPPLLSAASSWSAPKQICLPLSLSLCCFTLCFPSDLFCSFLFCWFEPFVNIVFFGYESYMAICLYFPSCITHPVICFGIWHHHTIIAIIITISWIVMMNHESSLYMYKNNSIFVLYSYI